MKKKRKDVFIEVPTATMTIVGFAPDVYVTVRAVLYTRMYEVAKEHKDLAKKYHAGMDRNAEIKESMISILFAYTCLEAYVNAIGNDRLGTDWDNCIRKPLDDKWKKVSRVLASNKFGRSITVFDRGKEPFKSFMVLKGIREDYLVHWKAKSHEPVRIGNRLEDIPISKFNYDTAEWACDTVKFMVTKLNENMSEPPVANWLD